MSAPQAVQDLVAKFKRDAERFRHPDYNEEQVRIEFINPLFEALGWDIRDSTHVVHEARVQVMERGRYIIKHPDYEFVSGKVTLFYLEAKKPFVSLKNNPAAAFQIRRYGWSKGLDASILTDFEELIIYNTNKQPNLDDGAHVDQLRYYTYDDYISKWDEIYELLGREHVLKGNLSNFAKAETPRGTLTVDEAFLREMEKWRVMLAKDITLHNREMVNTPRKINMVVQRTIDRIVFLRIAEARNIAGDSESLYKQLEGTIYDNLKKLFRLADDRYNSGLFRFADSPDDLEDDGLSLKIHISNEPLQQIINSLYYPASPYEFSVLPADILGQVYERFLGNVIELDSNGNVEVEQKPEVRKAGGVYYTPTYIVDYIVEHTVGKLLQGKTPKQVDNLRILDPACGSGSFLIGAYQYLLDWHLAYYSEKATATALREDKIRKVEAQLAGNLPHPKPLPEASGRGFNAVSSEAQPHPKSADTGAHTGTPLQNTAAATNPSVGDDLRVIPPTTGAHTGTPLVS